MPCTPPAETQQYLTTSRAARRLDKHPSAVTRWILRGVAMSTGDRLRLRAIRTPGGWRIAPEWLDDFLMALTADRLGDSAPIEAPRTPTSRQRELVRVDFELQAAGF